MQCYYDPQPGAGPLTWAPWLLPADFYFQTSAGPSFDLRRKLHETEIAYFAREALIQKNGPLPRRFYKYTKAEHVKSFIERGSFRVGTLVDYSSEKYTTGTRDPYEGTKTLFRNVRDEEWDASNVPDIARGVIGFGKHGSGRIKGLTLEQVQVSENLFVFCVSTRFDETLIPEFEGADACYEILAPGRFISDAIEAMRPFGDFVGVFECVYHGRRHEEGTNFLPPLLLKEPGQQHQQEVRIVWRPKITPLTVDHVMVANENLRGRARRIL